MAMSQKNTGESGKQVKRGNRFSLFDPELSDKDNMEAMLDLLKQNRPDSYDKADKYGTYGKIGKAEQFVKTEFVQTAQSKQPLRNYGNYGDYDDYDDDDDDDYGHDHDRNPIEGVRPSGFIDDQSQTKSDASRIVFVDSDDQEISPAEYETYGIEPDDFYPTPDYSSD